MKKTLILGAAMAAALAPLGGGQTVSLLRGESEGTPMLYDHGRTRSRPGKGKGRHPHHSSKRFVAMDKRAARKARNRRG